MSDNDKPSKSKDENAANQPSTSKGSEEILLESTKPAHNSITLKKNFRIGKHEKSFAHSSKNDTQQDPQSSNDSKSIIANTTFDEILARCEHTYKEKQISVLLPSQFDSMTSSVRTLRQSQSCFSNTALKCFLLQSMSHLSEVPNFEKKWDARFSTRDFLPKIDTATQSTPPEPVTIENATGIYSRDAVAETTSAEVQISPSLIPPRPIVGEPPLEGAPPSYSAVMRIGPSRTSHRRLFGRRADALEPSAPFISPAPPPTYAEAQGHYYRPVLVDSGNLLWGPDPMPAACQRCGTYIITQTTNQRSNMTHFAALALCICGCWPCCLLPYCMNSCKNTYHYCPNCNSYLGMYRPW
ncbi:uncharacterized protein [Onthophagus taurus]|uniref:uncharacterized protein isoform X2 n=1 Tax=Onthophagus taurus TaxID=166361 RepID=UPI0039BE31D8